MMLTLMLVGGVSLALVAANVMTEPTSEVTSPGLPGEATGGSPADAAAETQVGQQANTPSTASKWQITTASTLSEAEDLLDQLENQGYAERELFVLGESCFAVSWR